MSEEKDPRNFIRLDNHIDENDKIDALTADAFRALVYLWAFCSRRAQAVQDDKVDTFVDGLVPQARWMRMPRKIRDELTTAGLFDLVPENLGAIAHDYGKHQLTAHEVVAYRSTRKATGSLGAHTRWHVNAGKFDASCAHCVDDRRRAAG